MAFIPSFLVFSRWHDDGRVRRADQNMHEPGQFWEKAHLHLVCEKQGLSTPLTSSYQ
jgi:hypothetical protein